MTLTTVNPALLDTQAQYTGFKNRIINGAMVIDQRNAGAAVTTEGYLVDRWRVWRSQTYSIQQSTDAPAGFSNSIKVTKTNSTQSTYAYLQQYIEGFNFADMSFGTANAKTITISFWVKSSVTGTFSAGLANSGNTRSYPATYSITVADTWTQASITIPGDTSGTWVGSTSGTGAGVWFNFGANGTSTANTWNASDASSGVTGNANLGTTNGATFYLTGVQLEKGSTATSFDYRPYGTELALCQRYYETSYPPNVAVGSSVATGSFQTFGTAIYYAAVGYGYAAGFNFKVTKRTAPTLSLYNKNGVAGQWFWGVIYASESSIATYSDGLNTNSFSLSSTTGTPANVTGTYGYYAASSEL